MLRAAGGFGPPSVANGGYVLRPLNILNKRMTTMISTTVPSPMYMEASLPLGLQAARRSRGCHWFWLDEVREAEEGEQESRHS